MDLLLLIIIIMLLLSAGTVPQWPYARTWGYRPSGSFALVVIVLVLVLLARGH